MSPPKSPALNGRSTPEASGRIPSLDGLRAIAVLMVIVAHGAMRLPTDTTTSALAPLLALGPAGVRLFFVLSGFLITGILLRARAETDARGQSAWQVWRAFLIRRALRIFPLAYVTILGCWMIGMAEAEHSGWWYVTYTSNIHSALVGENAMGLGHFWSLAVEEQFYLVWPLLLLWLPRRWTTPAMIACVLVAGLCRGLLVAEGTTIAAYVLTPSRLDALAFGGLMAALPLRLFPLLGTSVACVTLGWLLPSSLAAVVMEWGAIGLSSGALLVVVAGRLPAAVSGLLTSRPMRSLGTISYGLYVLHYVIPAAAPIFERHGLPTFFPTAAGVARIAYLLVVSTVCATATWWLFERRLNDLKRLAPYLRTQRETPAAMPRVPRSTPQLDIVPSLDS